MGRMIHASIQAPHPRELRARETAREHRSTKKEDARSVNVAPLNPPFHFNTRLAQVNEGSEGGKAGTRQAKTAPASSCGAWLGLRARATGVRVLQERDDHRGHRLRGLQRGAMRV
jgi:hypothetical protein